MTRLRKVNCPDKCIRAIPKFKPDLHQNSYSWHVENMVRELLGKNPQNYLQQQYLDHQATFRAPSLGPSAPSLPGPPPLSSMTCEEGAVIVVGGDDASGYRRYVEAYAPGLHIQLPDLPVARDAATVNYVDGQVLLCGSWTGSGNVCYQLQLEGQFG